MAYNTEAPRVEYIANANQSVFTFLFKVYSDTNLKVYLTPVGQDPDDVNDLLVLGTDYTVTINGDSGGSISLVVATTGGEPVTLLRDLPKNRDVDYQTNGDLLAVTLNEDQNYQTYLLNDVFFGSNRFLRLPENAQSIDSTLPSPVGDSYLRWSTDRTKLENDTTIPQAVVDTQVNVVAAALSETNSKTSEDNAKISETNSKISETNGQLKVWEAEAEAMTSDSYATEPEDVFVKTYSSNGDGTFTATNTTEYSSLHYSIKSSNSVSSVYTTASNVLIDGSLALENTAITQNFAEITYTGNGTSQTITTGIGSVDFTVSANGSGYWLDRATFEVKDDAGVVQVSGTAIVNTSKVHIKGRDAVVSNRVYDGLRGINKEIYTDSTAAEVSQTTTLTSFDTDGITLDLYADVNGNGSTYILYQTLYTHIKWGTTNQGKKYVEAYNPVTRETMIMYEGSGVAGHEIPHSLGVALDYAVVKNLNTTNNWTTYNSNSGGTKYQYLNLTDAEAASVLNWNDTNISISAATLGSGADTNGVNQLILYGKAKSETWTIVPYTGTGVAGNFVETKDVFGVARRPARVTIKAVSAVSDWMLYDGVRMTSGDTDLLYLNLSNAETDNTTVAIELGTNGFTTTSWTGNNTAGVKYIALVEFDYGSGDNGSYFPLPTDDSNLNLTDGVFSFTNGKDSNGFVRSTESLTGTTTIDFAGVADGLTYVAKTKSGSYNFYTTPPVFDIGSGTFTEGVISMLPNPVMVNSETPQYIDYNTELATNTMDSLEVVNKASLNGNVKIVDFGTVYNNNRYVIDNPFGNENYEGCVVRGEILLNNVYTEVGNQFNGSAQGMGAFLTPSGIVVQTGANALALGSASDQIEGSGRIAGGGNPTSAPCRVIVTLIGESQNA